MRGVGGKRPRAAIPSAEQQAGGSASTVPWAGRVPKPAMDADSLVDYGSGFLRKSCDSCVSSKRRCDGQDPCTRCQRRKKPCHYTERKKCGPRSGQKTKTSKGTRRARLSPSPSASPALQSPPSHSNEQQAQQQYDAISHVPGTDTSGRSLAKDSLEWQYAGISLGPAPPTHAHSMLSADELSGDTTSLDYTDVSDAPSLRHLSRDGSGSSWWSLEEQQASLGMGMGMGVGMGMGLGVPQQQAQHHTPRQMHPPGRASTTGAHPSAMQAHAAMQAATWNAVQSGRRFPNSVGGVGSLHLQCPPQYPHQQLHQHVRSQQGQNNGGMMMPEWGSHGSRSSGPASSAGSSTTMNSTHSGNSGAESSEDEESSETGFGRAEEEVAAMLVRLGQARIYLSDNDGPASRSQHDEATAKAVQNARAAAHQQRGWESGRVWSDGRN